MSYSKIIFILTENFFCYSKFNKKKEYLEKILKYFFVKHNKA